MSSLQVEIGTNAEVILVAIARGEGSEGGWHGSEGRGSTELLIFSSRGIVAMGAEIQLDACIAEPSVEAGNITLVVAEPCDADPESGNVAMAPGSVRYR